MQRTCLKCGHVHPNAQGTALEACPRCGAIYSRVAAAMADGDTPPVARAAPRPRPARGARRVDAAAFLDALRAQSNYPTLRAALRFCEIAGYAMAVLLAIMAGVLVKNGMVESGVYALIWAFWAVIAARVGKEFVCMLADGVDGIVHLAARSAGDAD